MSDLKSLDGDKISFKDVNELGSGIFLLIGYSDGLLSIFDL